MRRNELPPVTAPYTWSSDAIPSVWDVPQIKDARGIRAARFLKPNKKNLTLIAGEGARVPLTTATVRRLRIPHGAATPTHVHPYTDKVYVLLDVNCSVQIALHDGSGWSIQELNVDQRVVVVPHNTPHALINTDSTNPDSNCKLTVTTTVLHGHKHTTFWERRTVRMLMALRKKYLAGLPR